MSQGVGKSSINIGIRYYPQESIQAFTVAYGVNAVVLLTRRATPKRSSITSTPAAGCTGSR